MAAPHIVYFNEVYIRLQQIPLLFARSLSLFVAVSLENILHKCFLLYLIEYGVLSKK